jgi:hypothetical protein
MKVPFAVILESTGSARIPWNTESLAVWHPLGNSLVVSTRAISTTILVLEGDLLGRGIILFNLGVIDSLLDCVSSAMKCISWRLFKMTLWLLLPNLTFVPTSQAGMGRVLSRVEYIIRSNNPKRKIMTYEALTVPEVALLKL